MYERIGKLIKLNELDLGRYTLSLDQPLEMPISMNNGLPFRKNSLELSLVSGLDHLAGLKKLRCIGVQDMDLCVGQEEVDWMKKHWRLEVWKGLKLFSWHGLNENDIQKGNDGYYSTKNLRLLRMIKETWPSISAN